MDLAALFSVENGHAHLRGSRCAACGDVAFPPRHVCGACGRRDLEGVLLTGHGSVVSSTHVATPPAGFDRPIDVALVDLEEGPRVFALLTAPTPDGASVHAVPAVVREGHPGFAFAPEDAA